MNTDEYQRLAMRTSTEKCDYVNVALGIAGETGEVIDLIKKNIYQGHELSKQDLKLELGDICWYVALACKLSGLSMGDVLQANIDKLMKRYPNGFTADDSINRVDPMDIYNENGNMEDVCDCCEYGIYNNCPKGIPSCSIASKFYKFKPLEEIK